MLRFLLVMFLGAHVASIVLALYLLLSSPFGLGPAPNILALLLVATLAGTAAAFYVLRGLWVPVGSAWSSLR
jgi:hypothetical protein